jgi:DNA-binding transcriptional MerR regulator
MYSVTAASRMSGVHPDTLRAWERRHHVIKPRRDGRGHRVYAPEDVERLRLLRRGTELGHPISRLAAMGREELCRVTEECPAAEEGDGRDLHRLVERLLDAAKRYRADECDEVLGLGATLLDPETLVRDVVVPAMTAAGEGWHRGEITTAQERLLTASARRTLTALIASYRRRANGPVLVLAGLPGEAHEVGLLVTALMASSRGVDCVYLGPDIPLHDVAHAAVSTNARCVGLGCVTRVAACDLVESLSDLCGRLPPSCEMWIGGCSAAELTPALLPGRCRFISSHAELCEQVQSLAGI